jgi:hypothetical protein
MIFRNAEASDCEALAHLHALSWRRSYQGLLAQQFLDTFAEDDRRLIWRLALRLRTAKRNWCELRSSRPRSAASCACCSIRMNGGDNHSARGFYERFGGISVERSFHHAPDGNDVAAVRYVWDGLTRLAKQLSIGH